MGPCAPVNLSVLDSVPVFSLVAVKTPFQLISIEIIGILYYFLLGVMQLLLLSLRRFVCIALSCLFNGVSVCLWPWRNTGHSVTFV